MALTLHVQQGAWRAMVDDTFANFPGLIPVVKGNGYGFGRRWLAEQAVSGGARRLAVGTVFETEGLDDLAVELVVLTPTFDLASVSVAPSTILTVASSEQADHLLKHRPTGPATVKVRSSMSRHGFAPGDVPRAVERLRDAGVEVRSISVHPALVGSDDDRLAEVGQLLASLPPGIEVSVSHLGGMEYATLRRTHADRQFSIRLGSALWHGDKRVMSLTATTLDVRPVRAGERVGYRGVAVPGDGVLVIVGAGSAHGVAPLSNGESPFHFGKRRLVLLELPHMHVSMLWVPDGDPTPLPGDEVDVQRPLIQTAVDRIHWI